MQQMRYDMTFAAYRHLLHLTAVFKLRSWLSETDHKSFNRRDAECGKMYGVLVCRQNDDRLGYLRAYSGTMPDVADPTEFGFCPSVYDRFAEESFYAAGERELNEMNRLIEKLEKDPGLMVQRDELVGIEKMCHERWLKAKQHQKQEKGKRAAIRQASEELCEAEFDDLDEQLKQEGAFIQREMKKLKLQNKQEIAEARQRLLHLEDRISRLKEERKLKSSLLQDRLFDQYKFLNIHGKQKSLLPIFESTPIGRPPSGAGDCSAPKLLQYAFQRGYNPIALAEFWIGKSPRLEVRRHNLYYPCCRGKCEPILAHMLDGMNVEPNPNDLAVESEADLDVVYEDDYMLVVDKPDGMLSAPGKKLAYSIKTIVEKRYPNATGPLLVHRLDMSTSGLLVIAKSKEMHKMLSDQFKNRTITKRYTAMLEGELKNHRGEVNLPLSPDYLNRPMQMVDLAGGKPARTIYETVDVANGRTRVHFYLMTGRTHQLRVHSAHADGLDCPIVGDDIYGSRDARLCLHASYLELRHPVTNEELILTSEPPF